MSRLRLYPATLIEANALVLKLHRHHAPKRGHRWSGGATKDGALVAAYICARPVARNTPQYTVAEVARLVTDGTRNACSFLYSAAARAALAKGYDEIQTFILASESGKSLEAAGWTLDVNPDGTPRLTEGGTWNRPSRGGRRDDQPQEPKKRYFKLLGSTVQL